MKIRISLQSVVMIKFQFFFSQFHLSFKQIFEMEIKFTILNLKIFVSLFEASIVAINGTIDSTLSYLFFNAIEEI